MNQAQKHDFMSLAHEFGRVDSALAAYLSGDASSDRRGFVTSGRDCVAQCMAHDFIRARAGCLSENIVQRVQSEPGFVLFLLTARVFYHHSGHARDEVGHAELD